MTHRSAHCVCRRRVTIAACFAALLVVSAFSFENAYSDQNPVASDCTFQGKKLYGKVQIVTSFPDVKVQVVTSFPDLKVSMVNSFPDQCGKWQAVDSFPDLKVQFVDSFPDFEIQYDNSFPGRP